MPRLPSSADRPATLRWCSLAALLVTATACRDATAPTASESVSLTAAIQALAFYQVSAGGTFSCGVTSDNRAYCWGMNDKGQLGDGTTTGHLTPFPVAGTLRFRQVSTGDLHTCGVTTDYRAYCWGEGLDGELGDGAATNRLSPVPVAGGRQFRQVDAGQYHTCGVSYPDNHAYCWGYNGSFALGDGTSAGRSTPVAVSGSRQFRHVKAGGFHTCGVTTSDKVFCWGWNKYGQVGDSSTASFRMTPSPVGGTRRFRLVDVGQYHSCGVTTTDRAFCWGNGRDGQIGDGKTNWRFWPRAVAGGLSFARVTTGLRQTCGETLESRAYCWGVNASGQLGDGTGTTRLTPVAVLGNLTFAQLSTGGLHTCGKTPASVAYCWGTNFNGELGNGSTELSRSPVPVAGPM